MEANPASSASRAAATRSPSDVRATTREGRAGTVTRASIAARCRTLRGPMPEAGLRIQDVADRVGLSVRTIRLYQTEGLVPSPRRHGRTALYDAEHVARLELIS